MQRDEWKAIEVALEWLASIERERSSALKRLKQFGVIRSTAPVGDLGEWFATAYYGVPFERSRHRGFDLRAGDKRVEVKALRSTEYRRGSMGRLTPELTHVFAIRLDPDYLPVEAFEIPRAVIEEHCRLPRMQLSSRVESDAGVTRVAGDKLIQAVQRRPAASEKRRGARSD